MEASVDKLKENPIAVPEDKRAALAALSSRIAREDPVSATKLNSVDSKPDVLEGLRGLRQMVESGRVTSVTQFEVDAIRDSIEAAPMGLSTRPAEQLAQRGLDAFSTLNPGVKQAAIGATVVGGGILGLMGANKFFGGAKKTIIQAWDKTLDLGEAGLKKAGSLFSWLLKTAAYAGAGALTVMGVQHVMKGKAPTETPPTV